MSSDQPSGRHQELLLKHLLERISRQMTRVDREVEQLRASLTKLAEVSPHIADIIRDSQSEDETTEEAAGEIAVESAGKDAADQPVSPQQPRAPRQPVAPQATSTASERQGNQLVFGAEQKPAASEADGEPQLTESGSAAPDRCDAAQAETDHSDAAQDDPVSHETKPIDAGRGELDSRDKKSLDSLEGHHVEDEVEVGSRDELPKPRPAVHRVGRRRIAASTDAATDKIADDSALTAADQCETKADQNETAVSSNEAEDQVAATEGTAADSAAGVDSLDVASGSPQQAPEPVLVDDAKSPGEAEHAEPQPSPEDQSDDSGKSTPPAQDSETDLSTLPPPAESATPVTGAILEDQPEWASEVTEKTGQTAESASAAAATASADAAAAVAAVAAIHAVTEDTQSPTVAAEITQDAADRPLAAAETSDDLPVESDQRQSVIAAETAIVAADQEAATPHAAPVAESDATTPSVPTAESDRKAENGPAAQAVTDRQASDNSPQELSVSVHAPKTPSIRSVFDPLTDGSEETSARGGQGGALPRRSDRRRSQRDLAEGSASQNVAAQGSSAAGGDKTNVDVATVVPPQSASPGDDGPEQVLQVPQPREEVFNAGTRHWTHGALHNWHEAQRQSIVSVPEGIGLKGLCLLAMCDAADQDRAVTIVVQTHREAVAWEHFLRHDAAAAVPATRALPAEIELCAVGSNAVPIPEGSASQRLWIGIGMDRWTGSLAAVETLIRAGAWVLGTVDDGESDQTRLDAIGLGTPAYRLSREQALELRLFGSYRIALVPVPLYRTEANRYQATTSKVADTTRALSALVGSSDASVLYRAAKSWSAESMTGRQGNAARAWLQSRQQQVESLADVGSKLAAVSAVLGGMKDSGQASILTRWSASSVKVATDLRKAGRSTSVSREKDRAESAEAWRAFAAGESDVFVSADVPHGHLVIPKAKTLLLTSGPVSVQQAVRRLSGVATGGTLAIMFAPGTVEDPSEDPYQCLAPLMNNATSLHQVHPAASKRR